MQNLSRQRCRLLYFYGVCCLYNPQNDGVVFQNDGFHFTKRRVYFLRGHTPLFCVWTVLSFRAFVCFALSFVSVPRFRFGCSDSFFVFFFFLGFVWWLLLCVYFCIQERSWRACHTSAGNSAGIGRIPRPFLGHLFLLKINKTDQLYAHSSHYKNTPLIENATQS